MKHNSEELVILDNSNLVESYPGVTLPLTVSFIENAYGMIFRGAVGHCLQNDPLLDTYSELFAHMVQSYDGRMYYRISNWVALLELLPLKKHIIPVWQEMLGLQHLDLNQGQHRRLSLCQKVTFYKNAIKSAWNVPKDMKDLEKKFSEVQEYFEKNFVQATSVSELLSLLHEIERRVMKHWYVTLYNDLYAFLWTGLLKKFCKNKNILEHITGIQALESLVPLKKLLIIAKEHGQKQDLLELKEVQEYLDFYGDRCPFELKLEVMTYREEPSLLEKQIRRYASDPTQLEEMIARLEAQGMEPEEPKRGLRFVVNHAQIGIQNREVSRLNRSRIYGFVRKIFLQIGALLVQTEHLSERNDVFFLTIPELEQEEPERFRALVQQRSVEYAGYARLPEQTRLVFSSGKLLESTREQTPESASWDGCLQGIGTSMGSVTGQALVLAAPDEDAAELVRGRILVVKTTDPGWVFLLTMACGIIAENGSLLSHTAIVSRELGIPAVVAVERATERIQTGDLICLNAATGQIKKIIKLK